ERGTFRARGLRRDEHGFGGHRGALSLHRVPGYHLPALAAGGATPSTAGVIRPRPHARLREPRWRRAVPPAWGGPESPRAAAAPSGPSPPRHRVAARP